MAKPGSDRDGAMVDKQAGKKVCEPRKRLVLWNCVCVGGGGGCHHLLCHVIGESRS